jgi:hypothetical protein
VYLKGNTNKHLSWRRLGWVLLTIMGMCAVVECVALALLAGSSSPFPPTAIAFGLPVQLNPEPPAPQMPVAPTAGPPASGRLTAPTPGPTTLERSLQPMPAPTLTAQSTLKIPRSDILWSANDGAGDLSQWTINPSGGNPGGGIYDAGTGKITMADGIRFNGQPALALSITNANGQEQAARIFRWQENPEQAYYTVWFFFPVQAHPDQWWNIVQFKSKPDVNQERNDPMWVLNIGNSPNGDMDFYLWDGVHQKAVNHPLTGTPKPIPVGCWTQVQVYYRRATDTSGQITIWQDGVKIYDLVGVQTAIADNIQWGLSNYTDRITPSSLTIYASSAMITRSFVPLPSGSHCS